MNPVHILIAVVLCALMASSAHAACDTSDLIKFSEEWTDVGVKTSEACAEQQNNPNQVIQKCCDAIFDLIDVFEK